MVILWIVICSAILVAQIIGVFTTLAITNTKWYVKCAKKVSEKYIKEYTKDSKW